MVRFSRNREPGATCTACTKLTAEDHDALHALAVERGISDYELTRVILVEYIRGRSPARRMPAAEDPGAVEN